MLIWIIGIVTVVIIGGAVALNISAVNIIQDSQIHTVEQKRRYITIIWAVPIFGVIYSMLAIRKDISKNQSKMEDNILSALKTVSDNLDTLEAGLKNRKNNKNLH